MEHGTLIPAEYVTGVILIFALQNEKNMCLTNIRSKSVSDGTTVMYKVFVLTNYDVLNDYLHFSKIKSDINSTFLTSPFENKQLTKEMLRGNEEYAADREYLPEELFDETSIMLSDKISDGFVHGYADKRSALRDLYSFYARNFYAAVIVKCRIPEGETYYDGDFDHDETNRVRATRTVIVERVEEMYSWKMTEEYHKKYGDYHVFVCKNQNPCRCVDFLCRICESSLAKDSEAYLPDYMLCEQLDNVPDLYNQ